jgi:chorismate synthase
MPGNTFGQSLRLTSFGESHGEALGGILDGFPPAISIDLGFVQQELDKRKPGQSSVVSERQEADIVQVLSGILEGKSTGAPIAFMLKNTNARSTDYSEMTNIYRPSHADFVYEKKYRIADHRGGGRASARETAVRVAAGAFAKILLRQLKVEIIAFAKMIGSLTCTSDEGLTTPDAIANSPVKCPDIAVSEKMMKLLERLKHEGDTTGGIVECRISGCPAGLGEPVFDKLSADLAKAMISINAAKGFEIGSGFMAASMRGSQHNDPFIANGKGIRTLTNHSGGIQAGISNGETIVFRVAFKPVSSIKTKQKTVDKSGNPAEIAIEGRHDPCVVPRAVAVVEAMAALVLADHLLRNISTAYFVNK